MIGEKSETNSMKSQRNMQIIPKITMQSLNCGNNQR